MRRNPPTDDRGMMTAFVAVVTLAFLFIAGMVYDGGQRITTYMRAQDLASNTARAAAQAIDPVTLYDADAAATLDYGLAQEAAVDFLADADPDAELSQFELLGNDDQVRVVVTLEQTALILEPLGTIDISASATSTAIRDVDGTTGVP